MTVDDPFRTATHGRSVALERLAARHPDAELIHRSEGSDHAIGEALRDPAPAGCLLAVGYLAELVLAIGWAWGWVATATLIGGAATVALLHGAHRVTRWRWRRRVAAATAWLDQQPFPIAGLRGWCAATAPMIDVTFSTPPTIAAFTAGIAGHLPGARVIAIDDRIYRVVMADPQHRPTVDGLRRFVDAVLVPLHHELGVVGVQLGGTVEPIAPRLAPPSSDEATRAGPR